MAGSQSSGPTPPLAVSHASGAPGDFRVDQVFRVPIFSDVVGPASSDLKERIDMGSRREGKIRTWR